MSIVAAISLALLQNNSQDAAPWTYQQIGETNLLLQLPAKPTKTPDNNSEFTLEHQGLKLKITATPVKTDNPLPKAERYIEAIGKYRTEYGNQIESIFNEAEVIPAKRFGAESSIGFTLEIKGGKGVSIGWHLIRFDQTDYEILVTGEKQHFGWILAILDSQRYIDLQTKSFKSTKIGSLGVETRLGSGFFPLNGVDPERATTFVLEGENIPVVGAAQLWLPSNVDYSNALSVEKAFAGQLTSSGIAVDPKLKVEESKRGETKTYELSGQITVERKFVQVLGVAFVFDRQATSLTVIFDPEDKDQAAIAKEIIESAKAVAMDE